MTLLVFWMVALSLSYKINGKEINIEPPAALEPSIGSERIASDNSSCPETGKAIEFNELSKGVDAGFLTVIDVRPTNYTTVFGMIPTSISIPFPVLRESLSLSNEEFKQRFKIPKPDTSSENLIVSCQIGKLAGQAWTTVFKPLHYCNVRVYYGSFEDWTQKGGKVVFPETTE